MDKEEYKNFTALAEQAISEKKQPFCPTPHSRPHLSRRLSMSLRHSIENLNEELTKFEKNFVSSSNAVCWAIDYKDVFNQLGAIIEHEHINSVTFCEQNRLFDEIGLPYLFKDKKIKVGATGQMQIFAADMMVSDAGTLLLCNKDFHYVEKLNQGKINVFFTTIDRMVGALPNAKLYSQAVDSRNFLLYKGSPNQYTYLFIIDNQRVNLLAHKRQRLALTCINCGRCEEVCPVDQLIGKQPYNNVFTGPIGRVVLPFLETVETYKHVVYACTLCGKCEDVCPVSLPIRDMLIASRREFLEQGSLDTSQNSMFSKYRKYIMNRGKMNKPAWLKQQLLSTYVSKEVKLNRELPKFEPKTFNQQFTNA